MSEDQKKLQALSDDYQKLQTELQSIIEARQKLESQQQENRGVQKVRSFAFAPRSPSEHWGNLMAVIKEFKLLNDGANIYKLVGPVLLKEEKTEAVMAVDGRLEFIDKEIKRVEKQISDTQIQSEKKKMQVFQLQTQMQQQQQSSASQVVG
ncbi:MAG: hypothetical protein M1824_004215 [Vezdaea acicularis]|nr:MAG: hypothetical protein M1824_004215 [Vezdaea acicularis]